MTDADRSLADQAAEVLTQALEATDNLERLRLLEEALRLHRLAMEQRNPAG